MVEKFCRKCYKIKPIEEFKNNKKSKDGKGSNCKLCVKEINHNYYKNKKLNVKTN